MDPLVEAVKTRKLSEVMKIENSMSRSELLEKHDVGEAFWTAFGMEHKSMMRHLMNQYSCEIHKYLDGSA